MNDYCSLSQPSACSVASFPDLVSPANQDNHLYFHNPHATSERPAPDQNHSLQQPSKSSECNVTVDESVEQDSLKKQIDSLKPAELSKMADLICDTGDTYVNI